MTTTYITAACREGNLEEIKKLLQNNQTILINIAFLDGCYFGQLHIVQWLYTNKPTIDISTFNKSFVWACYYGYLQVAQWLLQLNITTDISLFNRSFTFACINGQFEIAQWLYSIKPDINTSYNNEDAFKISCCNGYLKIAQWLYKIKPTIDISTINDAFTLTGSKQDLNVIQWLQSLNPFKYSIKIENNQFKRYKFKINNIENLLFILYGLEYKKYTNNLTPDLITNISNYI